MKKLIVILVCAASLQLSAQDHGNKSLSNQLKTLEALVGNWEGEGYIIDNKTRERKSFVQKEEMRYELDSTIISIKGVGTSDGKIVHDARAIICPADSSNQFEFYSFLADGRKGKFLMEKEGEIIRWFIEVPQGTIRYTITLKENEYHEVGEFGVEENWYPFMEMNLRKVN